MKHAHMRTATDVIVPDGEAGMKKLREATKRLLLVPKPAMKKPAVPKRKPRAKGN